MGLFGKIKNILFEEEDIENPDTVEKVREVKEKEKETRLNPVEEVKEDKIEKAKQVMEEADSKSIFQKEPSFDFPEFDEDEFENTMPRFKEKTKEEKEKEEERLYADYQRELKKPVYVEERKREESHKKPEVRSIGKGFSLFESSKPKEEPVKRFTPSPIISPVYGILDKDYHPDQISTKDDGRDIKRTSRLDVDTVRKKAFESPRKEVADEEKEEVKPVKESKPKRSVYDDIEDVAEEIIAMDEKLNVENNIKEIEDELDKIDDEMVLDEKPKEKDEDDTLEQDLFELIDSMYEDKKEDE